MRLVRPLLLRAHRYAGLTLAAFLILAGLTGSVAAFHDSLDAWLNPELFTTRDTGPALTPQALSDRLAAQVPGARLGYMLYRPPPGGTVRVYAQGAHGTLRDSEIFLDPVTGIVLGRRDPDGCCFGRRSLIPFLYRFHYTLGLGRTGQWIMGIAAMLWTVDCVVGLLLTLPPRPDWHRWGRSWRIAAWRPGIRLTFDLHRAVSLWLWVVLLGIAISGVALALPQVFDPVVRGLMPMDKPHAEPARAAGGPVGLDAAQTAAMRAAARAGWTAPPGAIFALPALHTDMFYFFDTLDTRGLGLGRPMVAVDTRSGAVTRITLPGHGRTGDLVLAIQFPWHSGQLGGLAGRIVIAISGVAVAMLSVTGVMIWDRKQRARRLAAGRHARQPHPAAAR